MSKEVTLTCYNCDWRHSMFLEQSERGRIKCPIDGGLLLMSVPSQPQSRWWHFKRKLRINLNGKGSEL